MCKKSAEPSQQVQQVPAVMGNEALMRTFLISELPELTQNGNWRGKKLEQTISSRILINIIYNKNQY